MNKSRNFKKQGAAGIFESFPLASDRECLARKASAEQIEVRKVLGIDSSDVSVVPHRWKTLPQDAAGELVDFRDADASESSRRSRGVVSTGLSRRLLLHSGGRLRIRHALEAELKTSDAGEDAEVRDFVKVVMVGHGRFAHALREGTHESQRTFKRNRPKRPTKRNPVYAQRAKKSLHVQDVEDIIPLDGFRFGVKSEPVFLSTLRGLFPLTILYVPDILAVIFVAVFSVRSFSRFAIVAVVTVAYRSRGLRKPFFKKYLSSFCRVLSGQSSHLI